MEQLLQALLLGLVQGLTEFLPISSSAHLRIVGLFFSDPNSAVEFDPGATFTAITQLGTELAVVIYFWRDIKRIVVRWFQGVTGRIPRTDPDVRMGWLVIIGTIPIVLVGYFAQEYIRSVFRSLWIVAIVLIVFGILLGVADRLGRKTARFEDMSYGHGIAVGVAQVLALFPGVSRSGATTTTALALGYTRPAAARFSFLLAVPAVFGSGLYELVQSFSDPGPYSLGLTLAATVVAFVVGFLVIAFFMNYISRRSFMPFVAYRLVLGVVLIVLLATGVVSA
ncbi:undecaprenyl-diphosphate phosphatase [Frigoribacterium faeni]|uniref:Undecaprenyl-diphosphatase n=1 Tax=Frigoribacterium faeni TaxID=145483 RepID=A0A7W3JHC9_9MICO|nr:undecaprenyl-diphosphate phosphatase [Frigoribacterium faeni]MBA8812947.1 undecaprenyl-diphosphatase [Frigoribacterium faeni]BFF14106.1 undecaprenyl-diphosphate phosphatase [Microbacterium flavescens]GEK81987.1 undecaprenyl-diphosphatase 2 [Frigoribacterium faeni]